MLSSKGWAFPMVRTCEDCGKVYDDVNRWTICPHPSLDGVPPDIRAFIRARNARRPWYTRWTMSAIHVVAQHPVLFVGGVLAFFVLCGWIQLLIIRWFVK